MKKLLPLMLLLLIHISGISQVNNDMAAAVATTAIAKNNLTALNNADKQWQSKAEAYIAESEYHFKKDPEKNTFYAANRQQQLGFSINAMGYKASPEIFLDKKTMGNNWNMEILFVGMSKGDRPLLPNREYDLEYKDGSLNFNYPDFSIQYINNNKGLRQNFIVNKRLTGNENLELLLKHTGPLTPSLFQNGIGFRSEGVVKLFYQDLKVWDADNRIIKAKFELRENNIIAIVVEDSMARYPLTVDPLNHVPEWTGTATGIVPTLIGQLAIDAAYGFSMAGVGDVNNDGFDDVAIGAPALVDIISSTGTLASVGAVFVYYGSSSGLPVQPSASLQPTTAIAGALFGYSIAGGDVNNDGADDIIVGAPLDNIIVNGQSGTIGKVYVFNGAGLSASTTPFLQVQLSGNSIIREGINLSVNALFGFSVAVTEDLNADGKKDIIVGAPTYAGIKTDLFGNPTLLDVQSGGAFIFLTNALNNNLSITKLEPVKTNLLGLISANINGLLFGYSVDGLGDYNNDGHPDVVATSPAGIDLGLLSILLSGKLLQGNASVFYGNGAGVAVNPGAVLTATEGGLLTDLTGTIGNVANLFGTAVKGVRDVNGNRNGSLLVGAPLGGALMNVLSLQLKTGTVSVFIKKVSSPAGNVVPDQVLTSPRNSNEILGIIQSNLLFGYSLDNVRDVNCDGFADIIIGEPASSSAQIIAVNAAGGAAYIYFGKADGTYYSEPYWTLTATADGFLGINGTSLVGFSVAGVGKIRGAANKNYILTGSPSRTLDFGIGLLDLGNTLGSVFGLAAGDNGVGKTMLFEADLCAVVLPVALQPLKASYNNGTSFLSWATAQENNSSHFEIEHSADGINFRKIGQVAAAGFSNNEKNYSFRHPDPVPGMNYYRLKMADKDGQYDYSNIVFVKANGKAAMVTAIYPRPIVDRLNVVIANNLAAANTTAELFDNTGRLVATYTKNLSIGTNTIILDNLGHLAKGSYFIRIKLHNTIYTEKLIK